MYKTKPNAVNYNASIKSEFEYRLHYSIAAVKTIYCQVIPAEFIRK